MACMQCTQRCKDPTEVRETSLCTAARLWSACFFLSLMVKTISVLEPQPMLSERSSMSEPSDFEVWNSSHAHHWTSGPFSSDLPMCQGGKRADLLMSTTWEPPNKKKNQKTPRIWAEILASHQLIPGVVPRIAQLLRELGFPMASVSSESCSENVPEFRDLLREWPSHSESVSFKTGVVPRLLIMCPSRCH